MVICRDQHIIVRRDSVRRAYRSCGGEDAFRREHGINPLQISLLMAAEDDFLFAFTVGKNIHDLLHAASALTQKGFTVGRDFRGLHPVDWLFPGPNGPFYFEDYAFLPNAYRGALMSVLAAAGKRANQEMIARIFAWLYENEATINQNSPLEMTSPFPGIRHHEPDNLPMAEPHTNRHNPSIESHSDKETSR